MLELILLIVGIVYAVRMPRLRRVTNTDYPGVDATAFQQWKTTELKGMRVFIVTTWTAFVVQTTCLLSSITGHMDFEAYVPIAGTVFVCWLIGLTVSAVQGSKAKKIKKQLGIKWPNEVKSEGQGATMPQGDELPLLPTPPEDDALFKRLLLESNGTARRFAEAAVDFWICVCGARNPYPRDKSVQNCVRCHTNRDFALSNWTKEALSKEMGSANQASEVTARRLAEPQG